MTLPFVRCGHHRRPAVLLLVVASLVLLVARHSTAGEKTCTPQLSGNCQSFRDGA